ncbi:MAG: exodeoxyribonuclease VII large subunit [Lachnospiraceae bacterium]|nr:exodeoxyribonuclease VII large subunit [Lachnospiraceae bacterium]
MPVHEPYSVSQVNSYIKNMFAQDYMLRSIYVKGEVSNVKYHSSGHIYFTLKDAGGQIACVMFATYRSRGLGFRMTDGQQIVVRGSVEVWEAGGKYQLYAKEIEMDGIGALYERFERLKNELLEMGMFDEAYKQPIPKYARTIGIVTAPGGAAVRDIINITKRRNPYIQLILYPATVQGEGAKESIVRGIQTLASLPVDVIIVGRGGGSIEELWAFNEEEVARAIFDCRVPVVSAVGHETDTTISDYVADLRAPTPSAAAELTAWPIRELDEQLAGLSDRLNRRMSERLEREKSRLNHQKLRLKSLSALNKLREKRLYLDSARDLLDDYMERSMTAKRQRLNIAVERLEGLSPLKRLKSGYALVEAEGRVITKETKLREGEKLLLYLTDKDVWATIDKIEEVDREKEWKSRIQR